VARLLWTAGCAAYLAHVWAVFEFFHGWSHAHALAHVLAVTRQKTGLASGAGLWVNHAFTAVWLADTVWWSVSSATYVARPAWVSRLVHGFLAFVVFNATAVFGTGVARALGWLSTAWLVGLWAWRQRGAMSER
jgi:hypothetical protein